MSKNGYKLSKRNSRRGYDWWWHSFVGKHERTGELKPFFIEYYVINPGLWEGRIEWGQLPGNQENGIRPCYAMIKAGTWGEDKVQLHSFFDISDFYASDQLLDCRMGHNILTEKNLSGELKITEQERDAHPEWMCDAGSMSWDLEVEKDVTFDVGYGSSGLANRLNLFRMVWHAEGMRSRFTGKVILNGSTYIVEPDTSYGYQDKNWGSDYTNPWIWLNCNNFYSKTHHRIADVSLDLGGGCPVVLGIPFNRRILTALYYEGTFIEFNFSKFWVMSRQTFNSTEDEDFIYWDISSENRKYLMEVKFKCRKNLMLLVNYENPNGKKHHQCLWNGGHGEGILLLYKKEGKNRTLVDELTGQLAGCEYGEY